MSGLAELLHVQGYRVSGSDLVEGATVERLRRLGVPVTLGHDEANIGDADVLVYSSAIRGNNPELREAEQRKIPVIPRAEMLAEVMRLKDGIAVAGSHGKTTTTSLIVHLLDAAGLDPTAVIGGRVIARPDAAASEDESRGMRLGSGGLLVAEADESDGSFLRLAPVLAVVTSVAPEHLDHYGTFEALQDAFVDFANSVPFWGLTVLCFDHPGVQSILPRLTRRYMTYGFSLQADLVATSIEPDGFATTFEVARRGERLGSARLPLPGHHNVANSLAAFAIALELDVPFATAAESLAAFGGVERRFERKGEAAGVLVVDDYGVHPTSVRDGSVSPSPDVSTSDCSTPPGYTSDTVKFASRTSRSRKRRSTFTPAMMLNRRFPICRESMRTRARNGVSGARARTSAVPCGVETRRRGSAGSIRSYSLRKCPELMIRPDSSWTCSMERPVSRMALPA